MTPGKLYRVKRPIQCFVPGGKLENGTQMKLLKPEDYFVCGGLNKSFSAIGLYHFVVFIGDRKYELFLNSLDEVMEVTEGGAES